MVVRALGHIGYNTALFSGISARRGGLSTTIEAGVPEAILWMQSGHAQDVAARRYVKLRSPKLLYRTAARGRRSGSSVVVHFQCCNGWLSGPVRLPARSPAGPGPGPDGGRAGLPPIFRQLGGTGRPGPGSGRLGPGPGHRLALWGFRRQARGGRLRGLPSLGRWAPPALFSPLRVSQLSCLPCVGVFAALRISRGPAGAVGRRTRYPYAFARLAGSLVAP